MAQSARGPQARNPADLAHNHAERNHQGVGNRLLLPEFGPAPDGDEVVRSERLGGLLSFYQRRNRRRAG